MEGFFFPFEVLKKETFFFIMNTTEASWAKFLRGCTIPEHNVSIYAREFTRNNVTLAQLASFDDYVLETMGVFDMTDRFNIREKAVKVMEYGIFSFLIYKKNII